MAIGIIDNVIESFSWIIDRFSKKPTDLIIIIALALSMSLVMLPINLDALSDLTVGNFNINPIMIVIAVAWIIGFLGISGVCIRVYRNGEAPLGKYGSLFTEGFCSLIIDLVYMIIPGIIGLTGLLIIVIPILNAINASGGMDALMNDEAAMIQMLGTLELNIDPSAIGFALLLMCIAIILALVFALFAVVAQVRFAKEEQLRVAFQLGEILKTIGKIGWIHYIISLIAIFIIICVIMFIIGIIMIVITMASTHTGFTDMIIQISNLIISSIVSPIIMILFARFVANLYESA